MIHFNKPFLIENEFKYIEDAINTEGILRGDGVYTKKCHAFLEEKLNCKKALLTHSCTAALEMAAILLDLKPGDEVIMPSYTFVSTANAFVLRGAVPVFVDIRPDTLNIDENLIEKAITPKTKAICCVHYAGVACEMDKILEIAKKHNLLVVEDAAQALGSYYKGKHLCNHHVLIESYDNISYKHRYLNGYLATWTSQRITNDVKFDLFDRLIHMHPQFFDENSSGKFSMFIN